MLQETYFYEAISIYLTILYKGKEKFFLDIFMLVVSRICPNVKQYCPKHSIYSDQVVNQ